MRYKRRVIFLYVIAAYILMTLAISFGNVNLTKWFGIIVGLSLMLVAIPFHFSGRLSRVGYVISFLLNSVGVGFSISTFYTKFQLTPDLNSMFIASVIGFCIVLIFGFMTHSEYIKPYGKEIVSLIIIGLYITSIVLWIQNDDIIYSLIFYYLHIAYFYMVGMIISSNSLDDLTREMSIISFSAFLLISIVVLIVISEGEALEGLDGLGSLSHNNKKNQANN